MSTPEENSDDYHDILIVTCNKGHSLYWFRCKQGPNKGKVYWKSKECKSFYNDNYISAMAPYDDVEKTVKCQGI